MPDYLLPCSCGQKTRITAAQAGAAVVCVCGSRLSAPTLRGLRQLEIAPEKPRAKTAGRWSSVHGALFASGLSIASIGLLFLAFYGLRYVQLGGHPIMRDITDQVVKAEQARIDKLTPVEALAEWSENVKDGLGEPEEPPWVKANKVMAGYKTYIRASTIALIVGAALAGLALALPRSPAA